MTNRAGQSFGGRELPPHPFAGDGGEAPAELTAAMKGYDPASDDAETALVAAVAASRLLVGVVAAPASEAALADTHSEMATITLTAPDGTRALPVFSSVGQLAAWRPDARPMPVSSGDAARAAIQEGASVMVLDLAGAAVALRGSMVWALAQGQRWLPAHLDTHVRTSVERACAEEPAVAWQDLVRGRDGGVVIELGLVPGLGREEVMAVARRIAERVAADGEARARIDAIEIGLRKA